MSTNKTKLVFKAVLIILKNATVIIPILEGIVDAIYSVRHPEPSNYDNSIDVKAKEYNYRDDVH